MTVVAICATNCLLGESLHLLYGLSSKLVSDVSWYPAFAIQLWNLSRAAQSWGMTGHVKGSEVYERSRLVLCSSDAQIA
jgi:hypothetical protein